MSDNTQKQQNNIPIVSDSFYWVRISQKDSYEPAKCTDYYGNGNLYFKFTDGSIIGIDSVYGVDVLNHKTNDAFDEIEKDIINNQIDYSVGILKSMFKRIKGYNMSTEEFNDIIDKKIKEVELGRIK